MNAKEKTAWPPGARRLVAVAAIIALTTMLLLWAPAQPAPAAEDDQKSDEDRRSGVPVEVVGPEDKGELADGDVLFIKGEQVPAKGAAVTLTDADGTKATLTDGENASLIPGASGMGMMVEGEPADASGGNGKLSANGLRMTDSEDVLTERPKSANLESVGAGSAEDGSDETAGPLADADAIKKEVREQIDAGMAGSGEPSPDTGSGDDPGADKGSSAGGDQTADGPSGAEDPDTEEPDSPQSDSGSMLDRKCFPFCETGAGSPGDTSGTGDDDDGGPSTSQRDRQTDDGSMDGGDPGTGETGPGDEESGDEDGMTDRGTSPEDTGTSDEDTSDEGTGGDQYGPGQGGSTPDEKTDDGASPQGDSPGGSPESGSEGGGSSGDDSSGSQKPQGDTGSSGGSSDPYADLDLASPSCNEDFNGVATHVAAVGCEIFSVYGHMDYSGYRAGDPQDHGKGLALDYMVYEDTAKGDAIAADGLEHWGEFQLKYIIWQQRINFGSGWEMMEDRGSITANHGDHPHFSHQAQAAAEAA